MKVQTLINIALCALLALGAFAYITNNTTLLVITPPLILGALLFVGVALNTMGVLIFPPKDQYKK